GIALTPEHFGLQYPRQMLALLRLGAELHDHRRHHHEAERNHARRAGFADLVVEDVALERRPAGPAVFLGPARRHPAFLVEDLLPARVVVLAEVKALLDLVLDVGRELVADEGAHLLAEGAQLGRKIEIHAMVFLCIVLYLADADVRPRAFVLLSRFAR